MVVCSHGITPRDKGIAVEEKESPDEVYNNFGAARLGDSGDGRFCLPTTSKAD